MGDGVPVVVAAPEFAFDVAVGEGGVGWFDGGEACWLGGWEAGWLWFGIVEWRVEKGVSRCFVGDNQSS